MKKLVLILGDQLDINSAALNNFDSSTDEVLMIESRNESNYVWSHKAKIAIFLSAMRHFAQIVQAKKMPLTYIKESKLTIEEELRQQILEKSVTHLVCVEPGEWRLKQAIENLARELNVHLLMKSDDHFYCSGAEFREWVKDKKELRLEYFYRYLRKKHNVLMDEESQPIGGQWNFDDQNRRPYSKKGPGLINEPLSFPVDEITREVFEFIAREYPEHPGSLEHFSWPVTREQALVALDHFVNYRLASFGMYQDAMWKATPFGWHSILSTSLNLKLINPREVIKSALDAFHNNALDLATVEGNVKGQQFLVRRLLTNPGTYIFELLYGAGLASYIGTPTGVAAVKAIVTSQLYLEKSVSQTPQPTVSVTAITNGVNVIVQYVDADTGAPVVLNFNVNE